MKELLLPFIIGLALGVLAAGCTSYKTAKDTVKLTGKVVTFNEQVEQVQTELAQYSNQPVVMYQIDAWQQKLAKALKGEINTTVIKELYTSAVDIYKKCYAEAHERWGELNTEQRFQLQELNSKALSLQKEVNDYLNDPETVDTKKLLADLGDVVYYGFKIAKTFKDV